MPKEKIARYLKITEKNLSITLIINVFMSLMFLMIIPIFFGINDLERIDSLKILEQFVSIIGIILLTPIFRPEGNKDIREVIESKYTSQTAIYILRILMSVVTILLLIWCFSAWMEANRSVIIMWDYVMGTFATAMFLGSLGLLVYAISDQLILSYLCTGGYLIFNLFTGSRYVGKFYLYSMMRGSMEEKYWLLGASVLMLVITLFVKYIISKLR
ncbi:MAG TPA: ABC transporter permease [Mobilitalea sp.]|nr:ABC transporter permease [Mobilitalea sp.]